MANIFQFKATNKVQNTLGLGFANVSAGDVFLLTDVQLKKSSVRNAIELGYVEPVGEMNLALYEDLYAGTGSEAWLNYLDGVTSFRKNMMPALSARIIPPIASGSYVNTVAADLCGGYVFGRKVAITGFEARFSTAPLTAGINVPRLIATAGVATALTPTILTSYTYLTGAYAAATNASIAAAAPITWAANDMLIVGYTSKFASVVCNMTTESSATTTSTPYYWDGSAWVEFTDYNDYTCDAVAGTPTKTFSRVGNTDNARIVWWETPDDWVAGGPTGSDATITDYCIAIKFSGALTALAGASVYPVCDTPIADINLGTYGISAPSAVIKKLGANYVDETAVSTAWSMNAFTTTDYIWVGFASKQQGFAVDMTGANANVVYGVFTYWNGISWVSCPTVTDGTDTSGVNTGPTWAQDGTMAMASIPTDWVPSAATNTSTGFPGTSTPSTVTTDELYWIRYTVSGALDASGTGVILYGVPGLNIWHNIEPKHLTFVDSDEELHVWVVDENTTIDALSINAMVADI